jgi:hypothetical protein
MYERKLLIAVKLELFLNCEALLEQPLGQFRGDLCAHGKEHGQGVVCFSARCACSGQRGMSC